jgi:radical SAM superfamily enzyme YgiQ (UPF0313 family)
MASKVLLVSVNTCTSPYPVFPIGLAHVAGALRRAGHAVEIADCALDGSGLENIVIAANPAYIGLSLRNIDDIQIRNTRFFADGLSQVTLAMRKASSATIIIGGSGYSLFPKELLGITGADFGIQGEGDIAFASLLEALVAGKPYQAIPGLVYRSDNGIVANPNSAIDPARIAPAFRPVRLVEHYLSKSTILNVQTQRGCSSTCCYCTYPLIEGTTVRSRDMEDVGDELEKIKHCGGRYFFIVDSVFNSSESHVRAFCEKLLERDLGLSWGCFLRPAGLSQELVDLMAKSGLSHIEFGSDSYCDRVLDEYGKNFTFNDIYNASEYARKARVHYAHFLIIGGPGETDNTMREGFANSRRLAKTVHFPFVGMRIYPGTPLHGRAIAERKIDAGTDLLRPLFYIAPALTEEKIFSILSEFSRQSQNWIIGELPPEKTKVIEGLRQKGIEGPLWEFLVR